MLSPGFQETGRNFYEQIQLLNQQGHDVLVMDHQWAGYTSGEKGTLDKVSAPVLLLHGAADQTVFPERAKQDFVALRRLGKTAELVLYEGEDHAANSWTLANVTDYWARIIDWFDRHLQRPGQLRSR